jgi:hypothetical protein
VQLLAQRVEERGARVEAQLMIAAVDVEADGDRRRRRLIGPHRAHGQADRAPRGDGRADEFAP